MVISAFQLVPMSVLMSEFAVYWASMHYGNVLVIMLFPFVFIVQKLIAYDHLEGDPGLEGGKNAQLFADILNMVCGCVDNSTSDR